MSGDYGKAKARILLRDVRWVPAAGMNLAHDHEQALSDIALALNAAYAAGQAGGGDRIAALEKALSAIADMPTNGFPVDSEACSHAADIIDRMQTIARSLLPPQTSTRDGG